MTSSTGRRVGRVWLREERRKALADAMARRKERKDVDTTGSTLDPNPITPEELRWMKGEKEGATSYL